MDKNPILHHLEAAKARLAALSNEIAALTRERDIAKAQMDAYVIASEAFEGMKPSGSVEPKKRRNRLPSADWMKVFRLLVVRYPDGFGYDEIVTAAEASGVEARRSSLRTKMMNYANEGYFDRVDNGQFSVTIKGRNYFKIDDGEALNENGPQMTESSSGPEAGGLGATTPSPPTSSTPAWAQ